jgi:SAM-dependent methyltransferase
VAFVSPFLGADGRLDAPAFHRNHQPIWSVLAPYLQARTGDVLELGSGTGQHIVEFARRAPHIMWWPSDTSEQNLKSIAAWRLFTNLANLRPPARIDLAEPNWTWHGQAPQAPKRFTAIFCANVIHIAPWRVAQGLFAGAARHLAADGRIFLYGPFMKDGQHTAPSNAAFDASLRAENPEWGVRDIADLRALAEESSLILMDEGPMPANNFILIFERSRGSASLIVA